MTVGVARPLGYAWRESVLTALCFWVHLLHQVSRTVTGLPAHDYIFLQATALLVRGYCGYLHELPSAMLWVSYTSLIVVSRWTAGSQRMHSMLTLTAVCLGLTVAQDPPLSEMGAGSLRTLSTGP